jgi:ribosomal protein S18 acetylase RimI-like enzyme
VGRRLVALARERLRAEGARATFAEVPDDAGAVGDVLGLLAAMGFREEGRVADFYRDAVALLILRG